MRNDGFGSVQGNISKIPNWVFKKDLLQNWEWEEV